MSWEPDGYVEAHPDEWPAVWHSSRGCGLIRFQKHVFGPVNFLDRKNVVDPRLDYVSSCKCAEGQVSFASETRTSVRTVSGGLPTLGRGHR